MELSVKIKALVKRFEGCSLKANKCPAGVWTIGYGHTGADVHGGQSISQAQADKYFEQDLARSAEGVVRTFPGVALKQCQLEALASLSFNIGALSVKAPTLVRLVKNNPDDPAIRAAFMQHVNARVCGVLKQLPGLVKRRAAEADHYFGK